MDIETQKIYAEGEAVSEYVKSKAWGIVKQKFHDKILDLQNVRNVNTKDVNSIALDVLARQAAVDILEEFTKEIEGLASQFDSNKNLAEETILVE